MSASAWDRAVEAAAIVEAGRHQVDTKRGGCTCGFCAWSAEHVVIYAVRAAVPVLLEELADALQASDIEKAGPGCCNWDFGSNVKNKAVRIVRGFAAEVTK